MFILMATTPEIDDERKTLQDKTTPQNAFLSGVGKKVDAIARSHAIPIPLDLNTRPNACHLPLAAQCGHNGPVIVCTVTS